MSFSERINPRLKECDYAQEGGYFVTVCAEGKKCLFGEVQGEEIILNEWGRVLEEEWLRTATIRPYVELDMYVTMPNHFHGIIMIRRGWQKPAHSVQRTETLPQEHLLGPPDQVGWLLPAPTSIPAKVQPLGIIVGQFKAAVAKRLRLLTGKSSLSIWQCNYHEHIIRDEDDLNRIREYIATNPLQWALDPEFP